MSVQLDENETIMEFDVDRLKALTKDFKSDSHVVVNKGGKKRIVPKNKAADHAKDGWKQHNEEFSEEELEEHLLEVLGEEEFAQLDELSKKTLGSYIGKATQAYANHSVDKARHARDSEDINRMKHNAPDHVKKSLRDADDASHKAQRDADGKRQKRGVGVLTAVKKLTKESIEEMISAANDSKPVEFSAAFSSAMTAIIADKLDGLRTEVAAGLFADSKE